MRLLEHRAARGQSVEVRRSSARAPVRAERVGAQRVDRDQHDAARVRRRAAAARDPERQREPGDAITLNYGAIP